MNHDLVACAMALRDSLTTHDDANNLILLLSRTRDSRRQTRSELLSTLKKQQVLARRVCV